MLEHLEANLKAAMEAFSTQNTKWIQAKKDLTEVEGQLKALLEASTSNIQSEAEDETSFIQKSQHSYQIDPKLRMQSGMIKLSDSGSNQVFILDEVSKPEQKSPSKQEENPNLVQPEGSEKENPVIETYLDL